jgi:hypothetical protein
MERIGEGTRPWNDNNPAGGLADSSKQKYPFGYFFGDYFSFVILERRDFLREAVFFLITPFFAALSMAL